MKTEHTPGPWGYQLGAVVDSEGYLVADIRSRWDDGMEGEDYHFANAALIAAAPELMEALELCLKNSEFRRASGVESGPMIEREIEEARAAIAKARGEA